MSFGHAVERIDLDRVARSRVSTAWMLVENEARQVAGRGEDGQNGHSVRCAQTAGPPDLSRRQLTLAAAVLTPYLCGHSARAAPPGSDGR